MRVQKIRNDSELLKPAYDLACRALTDALKYDDVTEQTKVAIQAISAFSRLKATERAGQTLKYQIISDFASNNTQLLRKLVQNSLPELAPKVNLLTDGESKPRGRGRPRKR